MSNGWLKVYGELKDFVADNPKIEIGLNVVAIPGDIRPRFYRLFDAVRVSFLEEGFPGSLDEAKTLSRNYTTVEGEVTKLLRLADIEMSANLNWFLHNPTDGLMRRLLDPLFNLLKGKIDTEAFEQGATRTIESSFRDFYRSGYEKWVALSLVKLLAPDKAFKVDIPDLYDGTHKERELTKSGGKEPVPEPVETKCLSFDQGLPSLFVVPDFIVHSVKIDGYVALGTELGYANLEAAKVSDKREWYSINSIEKKYGVAALQTDLTIYVDDKVEDIALIADFDRICRPDLIIECLVQKEWPEKADLDRIKLRHDTLKPRLGTYIVSREPVPEQEVGKQEGDIHILTVGFDQSQMAPIIELVTSQKSSGPDGNERGI